MRLSLTRSTQTRQDLRFGIAIACCAIVLTAAAAARSPVPSRSRAPRLRRPNRPRKRKTSPLRTGRRTTERSGATGFRRSTRSTAATSRSFASCAPTRCPRCPRCRPARSSSMARCTSRRKANSYSIDAATCAEKWRVERQSSRPSPLGVQRGFAYLDGRLFRGTSDAHVLALDAADGHTLWDARWTWRRRRACRCRWRRSPRTALVFIGNAGGDQTGVTGHVYALDAQDGRVVWRFDVVPEEPAVRATWPNADRYPITGGAFWTSFALDTEAGVLYVPAGQPRARLRRGSPRRRQLVHELADRARRGDRAESSATTSSSSATPTIGT